ncbi:hypothetical protein TWF281_004212 [Arthrobotrys megalospora]
METTGQDYGRLCAKRHELKAMERYPNSTEATVQNLLDLSRETYGPATYKLYPKPKSSRERLQDYEARNSQFGLFNDAYARRFEQDVNRRFEQLAGQIQQSRAGWQTSLRKTNLKLRETNAILRQTKTELKSFQKDFVDMGIGNLEVQANRQFSSRAKGNKGENSQSKSAQRLVNFIANARPQDLIKASGDILNASDYKRLKSSNAIGIRNDLAHTNWGHLATILQKPEFSLQKDNYTRIFLWVVGKTIEAAAKDYIEETTTSSLEEDPAELELEVGEDEE